MANRCKNCGWPNAADRENCEKCNFPLTYFPLTYDVFISYSRKDYVDEQGNVLPDNILSKIKKAFKENGISYWFDEEGIYSGDEFASVLTRAIRESSVFLFVSSANSNSSRWTSNEISTALEFKKKIIPFRIDNSPYNDSVMMKIISLDYIDCKDEQKAINKLLRAVEHNLPSIPGSKSHWRNIAVPEGARGTVVAFNVGGKWEEHVFTDENNKEEIVTPRQSNSTKSAMSEASNKAPEKSVFNKRLYLWLTVAVILLLFILGGLFVLWNKGNSSEFVGTEEIVAINEDKETVAVDLGLPSGTMWADRNVGAKSRSDFGSLYAWGEVKEKEDYSIYTYVEQLKPTLKITSQKHDAAATVIGIEWALPTEDQFSELLTECRWVWKKVDGHNGYEIIGKNGNKLFLPAAGWSQSTEVEYRNQYGYYWTSERSTNPQFARSLQFPKNGKGIVGNGYLYVGRSVRAVLVNNAIAE